MFVIAISTHCDAVCEVARIQESFPSLGKVISYTPPPGGPHRCTERSIL